MLLIGIAILLLSLALTLVAVPRFINVFHKKKIGGQPTLEEVKQHAAKAGTPTMGGVVFVATALIVGLLAALIFGQLSPSFIIAWWVLAMYAVIGFFDDFLKIFKKRNQGLTALQKLLAQLGIAVVSYLIYSSAPNFGRPPAAMASVRLTPPPGFQVNHLDIFNQHFNLGIFFLIFLIVWLVGWSNAVNLTDGIDGLASITVVISLTAYAVIAVVNRQLDVLMMILAVIGGLLGFFVFNHKPAKIFMGDVGSLALGGFIAIVSILLHAEWTLIFIGFIYIMETLSVMMQVSYFKVSHGKRIFRMTPIHHHFELGGFSGKGKGWSEWKIDVVFWLVALVLSGIALFIYFS